MKKFLLIFSLLLFSTSAMIAADDNADPFLHNLADSYKEWHNVEFSGKLHCSLLPLSPSVKIYMEKDSLIQISVRVCGGEPSRSGGCQQDEGELLLPAFGTSVQA